jgi:hypothetical protein
MQHMSWSSWAPAAREGQLLYSPGELYGASFSSMVRVIKPEGRRISELASTQIALQRQVGRWLSRVIFCHVAELCIFHYRLSNARNGQTKVKGRPASGGHRYHPAIVDAT